MNHTLARAAVVLPFALAAGLLAGCTGPADPTGNSAANDAAAAKFVACLEAAGQTAKIIDSGQVGLLMPESEGDSQTLTAPGGGSTGSSEGGPAMTVSLFVDDDGAWMAASSADGYPEEGGMREAWAGCETDVPDFEQPQPDMTGTEATMISQADMIEIGLAFAECARDEGYADFADPDENGMVTFPLDITEDEFRSLLEACVGDDEMPPPISQESAESFDFDWMAVMQDYGLGVMSGVAVPVGPTE